MQWDSPHRRTAGFAIEILRHAWTLGTLSALAEHPHLRPKELINVLRRVNDANAPLVGLRDLADATVSHVLGLLVAERLAVRCDHPRHPRGVRTTYEISRLGAGLIGSTDALAKFGLDHWEHVVDRWRRDHDILVGAPIPHPASGRDGERAAAGLSLSLLDHYWAFPALVFAAQEPSTPAQIADQVNAGLARHADLRGRRTLGRSSVYDVMAHLEASGLLEKTKRRYAVTGVGEGLLDALWEVAEWGIPHDKELWEAMAVASGWPSAHALL